MEHIQFQSVLFKLLTQIFVMIMKSLIVIENGWLEKYIFDSKRFPTSTLKRSMGCTNYGVGVTESTIWLI